MMSDGNESRLSSIATGGDRNGLPLWPIFIILLIGAIVLGVLTVPCIELRLDYMRYAPEGSPMSVWQMQCEKEGGSCVCRQEASSVQGGDDCEFRSDLIVKCRAVPADALLSKRRR